MPWCITLDNSKGISRLRFWCKNSRVNGINDLPVFMHQGIEDPAHKKALLKLRRRAQRSSAMQQLTAQIPEAELFLQGAFDKGE